ncbi:nitroreductase family protein [Methanobacterium congolense]|uniref:Putative NADH dehydrogenase/NAD(P)H nitroreductase AF_0226 n=1 Tax=Methanobacterium congolense TaxID=118062 RepID=A0A1D3L0W1_9EURY|nr:nitroreductase family protein [Methanobacterium congolense]SCG85196.1 putative NADH dehydrogenase/NAD(P)H nitroreductase AF_0226 [Methanobacterium congolense]
MKFMDLIKGRYSVRRYESKPVEGEKLEKILEAVRVAPTAANKQPFKFIVVNTEGREEELKTIYGAEWFTQAPLVICGCAVPEEGWVRRDGKNYSEVDVTIAMDHLILEATNLGLGTCWIAAFNADAARKVLNLPEGVEPVLFTTLGYPADEPQPKTRKELSQIVHYEHW